MATQISRELANTLTKWPYEPRELKVNISEARRSKRQTLEFREAQGTLKADEIKWWFIFVESVVRLAQSIVEMGFDSADDLYEVTTGRPGLVMCDSIFDHVGASVLSQEGVDFFDAQKNEFAALGPPSDDEDDDDDNVAG